MLEFASCEWLLSGNIVTGMRRFLFRLDRYSEDEFEKYLSQESIDQESGTSLKTSLSRSKEKSDKRWWDASRNNDCAGGCEILSKKRWKDKIIRS